MSPQFYCSSCPYPSRSVFCGESPWWEYIDRKSGLKPALSAVGARGEFLRCTECLALWFARPDTHALERLPKPLEELAQTWAKAPQRPSAAVLAPLESIGASLKPGVICFPCRGHTKDGRILERCLLHFQNSPPRSEIWGTPLLVQDLASIEPTPEALPAVVRQVAALEWENGRGYAPTHVTAPDGSRFVLNFMVHFFAGHGHLGRDLSLSPKWFDVPRDRVVGEEPDRITLVVADWDEEMRQWLPPKPPGLPKWMQVAWN